VFGFWFLRENNNHNMSGATLDLLGTTFVNLIHNKVYKELFAKNVYYLDAL